MNISIKNKHPKGNGRWRRLHEKRLRVLGTGASASGGGSLPDDTDCVSIMLCADDGEDTSTSTHYSISFGLDDNPNDIDTLIGKLTDLRAHQQRRGTTPAITLNEFERMHVDNHKIIKATKALRERTGCSLMDAKKIIDAHRFHAR